MLRNAGEKMQALVMDRSGLSLRDDVPRPVAGPGEAVLEVKACALNRADLFMVQGLTGPGIRERKLPRIGGGDIAGVVVEVGEGVDGVRTGDPVVVYSGVYCGKCDFCRAGEHTMCDEYEIIGESMDGGLAEFTKVRAGNLIPMPADYPFTKAAAAPATFGTAWRALINRAAVRPGQDVLILGASGGVGTAAIQIAKLAGARVFAAARGEDKLRRLREIGADRVFDYSNVGVDEWVAAETNGRGVDVVFDHVGAATWRQSIRSLKMGGRMVVCGATSGDNPEISIRELYQWHRQILGAPLGNQRETETVLELVWRGLLEPVIHAVLPLSRAIEGFEMIERREHVGKIVIEPGS